MALYQSGHRFAVRCVQEPDIALAGFEVLEGHLRFFQGRTLRFTGCPRRGNNPR